MNIPKQTVESEPLPQYHTNAIAEIANKIKDKGKVTLTIKPSLIRSVRIDERSRNRMKVMIKFSADEAQSYKEFVEMFKPNELSVEDFAKAIFLRGSEALGRELMGLVQTHLKEVGDVSGTPNPGLVKLPDLEAAKVEVGEEK